jgi:hypothetical protein
MRTITLEEHFASPAFIAGPGQDLKKRAEKVGGDASVFLGRLCDLAEQRIAEMDTGTLHESMFSSCHSPHQGPSNSKGTKRLPWPAKPTTISLAPYKRIRRDSQGSPRCPLPTPRNPSRNWSSEFTAASRARLSTVTFEGAIWMTSSFGPFWNAPRG